MLLIITCLFPAAAGILASALPASDDKSRNRRYAAVMLLTDLLALAAMRLAAPVTVLRFTENATVYFALDGIGRLFLLAVLILYTCVVFYAFEYMKMEERPEVFFGFLFLSLGAMIGVCGSGNMLTVYCCFEFATLSSMPLVLHEMSREAVAAAMKYLYYSVAGALMGLLGVFFVYYYSVADKTFRPEGILDPVRTAGHEKLLLVMILLAIFGFGTKAGMYPMHGWLPAAHPIAPAPASSLLSGIIVKAGILAVIRMVYYTVGADFVRGTFVQYIWMSAAMLTVFMGSTMAFLEKNLKKRLAYSTVSQISYILLGLSIMTTEGFRGGMLHLLSHAVSKGCLFLVAGIFICKLGKRNVTELKGTGREMPVTLWCFMLASLSLVGIPPMGGFTSKWVLAGAALGDGMGIFSVLPPVVLLISALLTAGYLFPIAVDAFFPGRDFDLSGTENKEPPLLMTIPLMLLCLAALAVGVFGGRIVELI